MQSKDQCGSSCLSLHEIVAENDVELLTSKLQSSIRGVGVPALLNQKDDEDQTPLHVAAVYNRGQSHFEVAEILLNNGADVNALGKYNKIPLWFLIKNCNVQMLKLFLRFNTDAAYVSILLMPAIEYSNNKNSLDVVKFLVQNVGSDVNDRDLLGRTPLSEATYYNKIDSHFEVIEYLLENGADVNSRTSEGCTPLWNLVRNCNYKIFNLFLKFEADLDVLNGKKESLLFPAAKNFHDLDVIRFLVQDISLDINHKNTEGITPLHKTASNNKNDSHYQVLEYQLEMGADVNPKDDKDRTPLWYLIGNCNLETLKLFLKFKANFHVKTKCGSSLLTPASKNCNNPDVVKFLVQDIGLDVNRRDPKDGMTPLHNAANHNNIDSHFEIVEFLLEKGADVNVRDDDGFTPLHKLVTRGNMKIIDLFLKYKADVHAVSNDDSSILFGFYDESSDTRVLQKLISDFHLNVNQTNSKKLTPLHFIIDQMYDELIKIEVIKCFLKNGADINVSDKNGVTPIIKVVRFIDIFDKEWFLDNLDYFDFLIDQADFSVVYNNKHVLGYYNDEGVEVNHQTYPEYLWKWIVKHLVKLKFLSIEIHPVVLEFIESHSNYKDYLTKCIEELEIMKNIKPQNSWINFLNLLVDDRRKLKNYAGSQDLIQDFENNDWQKMFSIYGASMKKNLEKGIKRRKLFDKSSDLFSDCLPIFNSTHIIVKDIFDCVLSKKDLSLFCKCRFLP